MITREVPRLNGLHRQQNVGRIVNNVSSVSSTVAAEKSHDVVTVRDQSVWVESTNCEFRCRCAVIRNEKRGRRLGRGPCFRILPAIATVFECLGDDFNRCRGLFGRTRTVLELGPAGRARRDDAVTLALVDLAVEDFADGLAH